MADADTLLLMRAGERMMIQVGAIGCIVSGALLFKWGVGGTASLIAEAKSTTVRLMNAAPGIFFAFFGAAIMLWALTKDVSVHDPGTSIVAEQATEQGVAHESRGQAITYSGEDSECMDLARKLAVVDAESEDALRTLKDFRGRAQIIITTPGED